MPPASYAAAASAYYDPQQQAESNTLQTNQANTIAGLEASKTGVSQAYDQAVKGLDQSVQTNTGNISQLYNSRLMGNFSGLQGNDMGMMYSKANDNRSNIELTRANKLAAITGAETSANNTYNTESGNLGLKYSALKSKYANDAYSSDQKAAQTQNNSDRSYNLSVARLNNSMNNSATTKANAAAAKYSAVQDSTDGSYKFTAANGQPVDLSEYASGAGKDANSVLDFLKNGTAYDKKIYNSVNIQLVNNKIPKDANSIIKAIARQDNNNYYGFKK